MSDFNRHDIKDFMRMVYSSQEITDVADGQKGLLVECGCEDPENPSLYGDPGASSTPEPGPGDSFTPEELYTHFDVDQDGQVSVEDYADHVAYHNRHPELLSAYERNKQQALGSARCPDSYQKAGDVMIHVPRDVIEMIKPIMQQLGVGCPHSFAQALSDVIGVAMDHEVVKPFSVE